MEPINWHTMTPEQHDRVIAEKVMNWQEKECDGEHGEVSGGWFCTKCGRDGNWGDEMSHLELPPRYTTSMDAAWLVVQEMVKGYQQDEGHPQFEAFADLMLASSEWDSSSAYSEIYPACEIFAIAAQWTPEAICIATLHACGYEVLTEEVKP
jgi:hypothetical protein